MKYIILILITLLSCNSKMRGPNYNVGISHNSNLKNRNKIVLREDARMKNAMIKSRMKATKQHRKNQRTRNKVKRRLIR